ncbi:MAG: hypothetical protein JRH19_12635, partial [Deltaproteobacteria bacterium]|nr:hypothetical protein [Deltaproteobacteria bacterium]
DNEFGVIKNCGEYTGSQPTPNANLACGDSPGMELVIDFDIDGLGNSIEDGANVAARYATAGVLFEQVDGSGICGDADTAYARDDQPMDFGSSPNVVSVCNTGPADFSGDAHGFVRALLLATADKVCVDALPTSGSLAGLMAFDAEGELLGNAVSAESEQGQLCVEDLGIRSVEFAGQGTGTARFDDLVVTFAGSQINFDEDPMGGPVTSGTPLNALYASQGVTLTRELGSNCGAAGVVYANDDLPGGFGTAPNVVSLCSDGSPSDFSETLLGMVQVIFSDDVASACIHVYPTDVTDFAVLRAFDAADELQHEVESAPGVNQRLCVATPGIHSLRFAGSGNHYARFDDLTFAVPEPTPNALGLAALLALAALRSRRRATSSRAPCAVTPRSPILHIRDPGSDCGAGGLR